MVQDIRWIQRFTNYKQAYGQLSEAVELMHLRPLSRLEKQGVIQAFEFTHELAWKTLKDFLAASGTSELFGSRDVTREAFKVGLIVSGEVWMQMIGSRNLTSHTYDEETAEEILKLVKEPYFKAFGELLETLEKLEKRVGSQ